MAFGYVRLPGRSRRYQNVETGATLSDRQYRKYIESIGAKQPGLRVSIDAIAATERALEDLRRSLASREATLTAREALQAERERELELEKQLFRQSRTGAGNRRYHALLESYVREQRRRGRRINKREAMQSPAFRQIVADMKGRANPRNNPAISDENAFRRRKALDQLGGDRVFRDQYKSLYGDRTGQGVLRLRRSPQFSARSMRRDAGRGRKAA